MVVAIIVLVFLVGQSAALEFFKQSVCSYFVYSGVGISNAFFVFGSFDDWKENRNDVDSQSYTVILFSICLLLLLQFY